MCAGASTILRAVAADFFFNCWYLEIPSDDRIRYIPRCVHYHAQSCRLETIREFLCWKWKPFPTKLFTFSKNVCVSGKAAVEMKSKVFDMVLCRCLIMAYKTAMSFAVNCQIKLH
jgi:hypothetical protein